jgi:hypothetical protein
VVVHRRRHDAAFNGDRRTPSDDSLVRCNACGATGRTGARYVAHLKENKP